MPASIQVGGWVRMWVSLCHLKADFIKFMPDSCARVCVRACDLLVCCQWILTGGDFVS